MFRSEPMYFQMPVCFVNVARTWDSRSTRWRRRRRLCGKMADVTSAIQQSECGAAAWRNSARPCQFTHPAIYIQHMVTARTPARSCTPGTHSGKQWTTTWPGIMRESLTVGHGLLAVRSLIAFFVLPNLIETSPCAQVHNGSRSKLYVGMKVAYLFSNSSFIYMLLTVWPSRDDNYPKAPQTSWF